MLNRVLQVLLIASVAQIAWGGRSKEIKPQVSAPVVYVRERSFDDLAKFGLQARAYTLMLGDKRIVVGVDYIRNLSGVSEELPCDLSDYVINAITHIGSQFGTYRMYPGAVAVPGVLLAAATQPGTGQMPAVDFWIAGSLERASEITKYESKSGADGAGGGGHTQFDIHAGRNRRRTIKSLTVTFTLEGPDKVSIPGASATYRIDVEQMQRERAFSVYVAGSGLSLDSTVTITQNLDDAIYDATAASVIHLLGNALLVPYYVCGSAFRPDEDLDQRVHDSLKRLTKQDLEQNLKVWMAVEGYPVDLGDLQHLTDHDRAVVQVEMHHRGFALDDQGLVEFAFSLWKRLDYVNGAKRVRSFLAEIDRVRKEQALRQATEQAQAAAKQREEERLREAKRAEAAALDSKRRHDEALRQAENAEAVAREAKRRRDDAVRQAALAGAAAKKAKQRRDEALLVTATAEQAAQQAIWRQEEALRQALTAEVVTKAAKRRQYEALRVAAQAEAKAQKACRKVTAERPASNARPVQTRPTSPAGRDCSVKARNRKASS